MSKLTPEEEVKIQYGVMVAFFIITLGSYVGVIASILTRRPLHVIVAYLGCGFAVGRQADALAAKIKSDRKEQERDLFWEKVHSN